MIVNIYHSTTSSTENQLLIYNLMIEMMREFNIKLNQDNLKSFSICQNVPKIFIAWLASKRNITAVHYYFNEVFNGYELVEDEHLTAYKLTIDLTKKINFS